MDRIEVRTPAKINLGLNIVSKREDGFHNLETIFYPINIFDEIVFEKSESTEFETDNEFLKTEIESNLIIKAIQLLEEETKQKLHCKVMLKKNIPTGAGLGGGSSDAAATLIALNNLFELNFETAKLKTLALNLGSDVPFFIYGKPCFTEGRGEIITPLSLKIPYPILLVNPNIHINTAWAFQNISPQMTKYSLRNFKDEIVDINILFKKLTNDFEVPVFSAHPEIEKIKKEMNQHGAIYSQMSGSGSTLFGIFDDDSSMNYLQNYFSKKGYLTFISSP